MPSLWGPLSEEKTTIVHIDEGFEFLGFRIQRQRKRGSTKRYVYTWPSKKSSAASGPATSSRGLKKRRLQTPE